MQDHPRLRTLSIFLIGAWLAMTLSMTTAAIVNFKQLKPSQLRQADEVFKDLGNVEQQRVALRYAASELNRSLFKVYGWGQLILGFAALVTLWASGKRGFVLGVSGLAFLTAALFLFWLVPAITEQGRLIDFMPREPKPDEVVAFDRLHRISEGLEGIKMLILALVSILLILGQRKTENRHELPDHN